MNGNDGNQLMFKQPMKLDSSGLYLKMMSLYLVITNINASFSSFNLQLVKNTHNNDKKIHVGCHFHKHLRAGSLMKRK